MVSGMEEDLKSISSQPPFVKTGPPFRFKCTNIAHHCTSLHHLYPSLSISKWFHASTILDTPRLDRVQELEVRLLQSRNQDIEAEVRAADHGPRGAVGPRDSGCSWVHRAQSLLLFTSFHIFSLFRSVPICSGSIWCHLRSRWRAQWIASKLAAAALLDTMHYHHCDEFCIACHRL